MTSPFTIRNHLSARLLLTGEAPVEDGVNKDLIVATVTRTYPHFRSKTGIGSLEMEASRP
jgi:hypothetical protein